MSNKFLDECKKRLLDTTARNNLINFRFSSPSCFNIEKYSQVIKNKRNQSQSFEGEKINFNKNEEELEDEEELENQEELKNEEELENEARKILGKMYFKQREIKNEKGFNPTSLAYGFFKYKDNDQERFAPIYLISTEITKNEKGNYCFDYPQNEALEVSFNHAIYEKFKSIFDINVDKSLVDFDDSETSFDDVKQRIPKIKTFLAGSTHGIEIEEKEFLGIFNSAKGALYNELIEMQDEFLKHNLLNIFYSKDKDANQDDLSEDEDESFEDARYIDNEYSSEEFFSPFDFDSSQLQAIKAAKDGKNFVIQGPPGTGKTQTISNIISELVAQGKKVLFVAEKKAAIGAVLKNFSKIDLEKIFLDLHDKKSKSKDIVSQILASINFFKNESRENNFSSNSSLFNQLDNAKETLNKRDELLHKKLSFGKKPFGLIVPEMKEVEKIDCDFPTKLSEEDFEKCLELLGKVRDLSDNLDNLDKKNPFLTINVRKLKKFKENDEARESVDALLKLFKKVENLKTNQDECNKSISELSERLDEVNFSLRKPNKKDTDDVLKLFKESLLEKENEKEINLSYKESKNVFKKIKLFFLDKKSKNLIKKLDHKIELIGFNDSLQKVISGEITIKLLESLVAKLFKNQDEVDDLGNQLKKVYCDINNKYSLLSSCLKTKHHIFEENNLEEIKQEIDLFHKYMPYLEDVIAYLEIRKSLDELSTLDFWDQFLEKEIDPNDVIRVFKKSVYSKGWDDFIRKNKRLMDTKKTSKIIEDFKELDRELISINKDRIISEMAKSNSRIYDSTELQRLGLRKRFPKPRQLISKYRDIIVNSVGCVVCSPLTICQYFEVKKSDANDHIFDTVIFDEASQIFTWDALSSIFRAKQMIIAGDTFQMPPTNLFASNDNDDSDEEEFDEKVSDYDGFLSFAIAEGKLRQLQLQWHYRSKFEKLIHPSNQLVYHGSLISFPSSDRKEEPVEFHYIQDGIWENKTNDSQAKYTIDLLKEIYNTEEERSVGVIAINRQQQTLIIKLIGQDEQLVSWLDEEDQGGLFVKNLENCQGDEREIIIVCSSYAKNKDGKVDGRMFSQINKDDAYKRLNVMFTRAKQKLHLLSSLKWEDIPSQYEGKRGMDFFKKYLRFAASGELGISANNKKNQNTFDSGFEKNVFNSLKSSGYEVETQVGCSGYKIDLAIICPKTKNYILGIECDGEMYHTGKTARERDRLRQDVLESKGWKIHRIWYYDWTHSQKEEEEKLKEKIEELIDLDSIKRLTYQVNRA